MEYREAGFDFFLQEFVMMPGDWSVYGSPLFAPGTPAQESLLSFVPEAEPRS
jgi:hypothetical protein